MKRRFYISLAVASALALAYLPSNSTLLSSAFSKIASLKFGKHPTQEAVHEPADLIAASGGPTGAGHVMSSAEPSSPSGQGATGPFSGDVIGSNGTQDFSWVSADARPGVDSNFGFNSISFAGGLLDYALASGFSPFVDAANFAMRVGSGGSFQAMHVSDSASNRTSGSFAEAASTGNVSGGGDRSMSRPTSDIYSGGLGGGGASGNAEFTPPVSPVPEPETYLLMLVGLVAVWQRRRLLRP
jgi:hypothetical protein